MTFVFSVYSIKAKQILKKLRSNDIFKWKFISTNFGLYHFWKKFDQKFGRNSEKTAAKLHFETSSKEEKTKKFKMYLSESAGEFALPPVAQTTKTGAAGSPTV